MSELLACGAVARGNPASPAFADASARRLASLRERRLVGLGRFELPTSRLSSARSNQLSYKPLIWRTAEIRARSLKIARRNPARARPRRKRNEDGGVPPMGMNGLSRHALMFPRHPIATA